ncbi:MAG: CPBP family intramembrane metalloprotease, partial [Atopobiaceae bacterium]|nr:CPBP family intramembrane metalloprotease [Atopobiaceae bacterium]
GMDLPSLLVQALYSTVVGLLFGAIYLRSDDIATVILAHAAIDLSNQVFATQPATSSIPMLVAFVAVLVALLAYSLWLMREVPAAQGQDRS